MLIKNKFTNADEIERYKECFNSKHRIYYTKLYLSNTYVVKKCIIEFAMFPYVSDILNRDDRIRLREEFGI